MEKLTRKQIDERLEQLRKTRLSEENYFTTRPAMAMCYAPRMDKEIFTNKKCRECGKEFKIVWGVWDDENIEIYEGKDNSIVEKFRNIGIDAKLICNCEICVEKHNLNQFEMWIKTPDEEEWHKSIPQIKCENNHFLQHKQEIDLSKCVSDFEYKLVLDFLIIPNTEIYSNLSYKGINNADSTRDFEDAGFIKTQIDKALSKVLGLQIFYDKLEIKKNIEFILRGNGLKNYIGQAKALLDETDKDTFTVWEYSDFMKSFYKKIKRRKTSDQTT